MPHGYRTVNSDTDIDSSSHYLEVLLHTTCIMIFSLLIRKESTFRELPALTASPSFTKTAAKADWRYSLQTWRSVAPMQVFRPEPATCTSSGLFPVLVSHCRTIRQCYTELLPQILNFVSVTPWSLYNLGLQQEQHVVLQFHPISNCSRVQRHRLAPRGNLKAKHNCEFYPVPPVLQPTSSLRSLPSSSPKTAAERFNWF